MSEKRKLLYNGKVEILTSRIVNRYTLRVEDMDPCWYDEMISDLHEKCVFAIADVTGRNFKHLDNTDWAEGFDRIGPDSKSEFEDWLKEYIPERKFRVFYVQVYEHSGVAFTVSWKRELKDQWDSSIIGLVAVPLHEEDGEMFDFCHGDVALRGNVDEILRVFSRYLTDLWEGSFKEYQIIDELTGDVEDSIIDTYKSKLVSNMLSQYGLSEES